MLRIPWVLLGFLLAQPTEAPCETHLTGQKAPQLEIRLSGRAFSPLNVPAFRERFSWRIPSCRDTIRVQVFQGQKPLLDTLVITGEGLKDTVFFEGGWIGFEGGLEGKVVSRPIATVVITGSAGHLHQVEVGAVSPRPEGLLAQQVSGIPGIYLAGAGPLLQKPLLEGFGGTRVTYLQEGLPLASQQWGEEHAPEIDPLSAERVYVELGARPVLYGTEAVGGVIGTETPLNYKKPLTGRFSLTGLTNGRGGLLSGTLGGHYRTYHYRLHATLNRLGTLKTPTYFLTGTASEQAHFAFHLRKTWQKIVLSAHYSQYNAIFGLFQGSHVGNLSDLQRALEAPIPPVTSTFTYQRLPPYQSTTHELTRFQLRYFMSEKALWTFTYARQYNRRSEWDAVGVYARAGKPAIDLQLTRHSFLQEMLLSLPQDNRLRLGLNFHYERNYAQYAYFIPRYEKYHPAFYALLSKSFWEAGIRVEPLYWVAYGVPERAGRLLTGRYWPRLSAWWAAWGAELQRQWLLSADTSGTSHVFTFRVAYLQRPPNAAELYAYGYHQGRAAFEIGQPTFQTENIAHLHLDWLYLRTYLCLSAYYSPSFIYARVDSPIVWIRGTSLAYRYQQAPATLLSLTGRYVQPFFDFLTVTLQGGMLWASYLREGAWRPLPLLPAPYIEPSVEFARWGWRVWAALRLTAHQWRYDPQADLAPPPPGYGLLSAGIQYQPRAARLEWTFSLSGDNLLNQPYRQYPDLMRYFANQSGRQVRLNVRMEF